MADTCVICGGPADWPDDGVRCVHDVCEHDFKVIQKVAQRSLKEDKQPTKCRRCGGKPGEPGCGKVVHLIMDGYFNIARDIGRIMGDHQ